MTPYYSFLICITLSGASLLAITVLSQARHVHRLSRHKDSQAQAGSSFFRLFSFLQDPCTKYTGPDRKSKCLWLTHSLRRYFYPYVMLIALDSINGFCPNFSHRLLKPKSIERWLNLHIWEQAHMHVVRSLRAQLIALHFTNGFCPNFSRRLLKPKFTEKWLNLDI